MGEEHTARDVDLSDQVAIVTGGGAGIGQGVAVEVARHGADVVILDIDAARAEQTAALVRDLGRRAVEVVADAMQTDQVRAAVQRADDELGRIDILVNNAGGVSRRRFLDQSEGSWRRHIDLNLVSMLAATSAAAPVMIRGGRGGSIVNVASIEASRAAPMYAVYAACKAAMVSFTRTMAVELSEHGIRVNVIAPDMTATPGLAGIRSGRDEPAPPSASYREAIEAYVPLGRQGHISECGSLVAFLCSPMASYITGTLIPIDGGTWGSSGWSRTADGTWGLFGSRPMGDG
jgi:NAD(P)-dependent dehydrogenase (short-subunit alcohol dehydrogenase family)